MRAAAVAIDAADVRDLPESGFARFAVRFARNSFGWGGKGDLAANRDGLWFTARRAGWAGYLRRRESLQVSSHEITSVLREGHVIRLQFQRRSGADAAHVEFAARDGHFAAAIVGYLPAAHTVEDERPPQSTAPARPGRNAAQWAMVLALIAGGLAAVVLVWNRESFRDAVPADAPAAPALVLPTRPSAEEAAIPASQLHISRSELRAAEERTSAIRRKFALVLHDLMEGRVTQPNFALQLNRDLIPQWRQEQGELSNRFDRISAQLSVLDLLKRSADLWTQALTLYSEGLREQQPDKVLQAFEVIRRAQALESQAYALVRDAERRSASVAPQP